MIIIDRKRLWFNTRQIWFSETIYDIKGFSNLSFSGCKNKLPHLGFHLEEYQTSIIDLDSDFDLLWQKMKKKSCRYAIQKANRDGIEIKFNHYHKEFYAIYIASLKQKYREKYREDFSTIKKYGTLITAELNGEVLGGHVYLEDQNVIMYWISANKRAESADIRSIIGNASHLIHWEAIKYAKAKGIKEFDMGGLFAGTGTTESAETIDKFKESFGGIRETRYNYHKDYSKLYIFGKKALAFYKKICN